MKLIKLFFVIIFFILFNTINLYANNIFPIFNFDRLSISISYNISSDASSQFYLFYIYKFNEETQNYFFEKITIYYQFLSIFCIFHKNIFNYGLHFNILFKIPIEDNYTILNSSANILLGLESNIPESIFIFQSGISFGLYYQYFSIPGVSYYNLNNEGFYDSEFSILLNFYFTLGIKINELMNLKLMLMATFSLLKMNIDYKEPFLAIVYEIFI